MPVDCKMHLGSHTVIFRTDSVIIKSTLFFEYLKILFRIFIGFFSNSRPSCLLTTYSFTYYYRAKLCSSQFATLTVILIIFVLCRAQLQYFLWSTLEPWTSQSSEHWYIALNSSCLCVTNSKGIGNLICDVSINTVTIIYYHIIIIILLLHIILCRILSHFERNSKSPSHLFWR